MGKSKKPYNWKARQVSETIIDKSEQKKIKVDIGTDSKYDDCNALVLPSKKRKTKVKKNEGKVTKLLSKTQRKKLEKIVAKKKKKEDRSSLLESLAKNQVSNDELNMLSSITHIQTKGLKRRYNDNVEDWSKKINIEALQANKVDEKEMNMNSIKGSRKRMRILASMFPIEKAKKDPNTVGLESSSDEISSDEELPNEPDPLAVKISNVVDIETKPVPKKAEEKPKTVEISTNVEKPVNREPAVFVPVDRSPEIQEARLKLPILAEEQVIMETINENPIVLLVGETGSGKTTQVPQFLYEAGYSKNGKLIGVTEPRRVAAISMAKRLGEELNLGTDKVSYLIRFEGNVTPETEIKFMTDGVLLKEIQSDFLLTKYSVIILDEAHERSVYTDILMGLLSRIVPLRNKRNNPLKLIIMSATLRVKDFTENKHLFKTPPPVIKVESRQFPVSIHFNKRTSADYLKEAYRKACRIHTQLPEGGILMFLTGQQEVNGMVSKLRKAFPLKNRKYVKKEEEKDEKSIEDEDDLNLSRAIQKVKKKHQKNIQLPQIDLDSYDVAPNDDTELDLLESEDEGEDWGEEDFVHANAQPMWVLPLYSILPSNKQAKVFQPPPEGCRMCIVATNVAETSLTIPGVKYVIDTGKVKTKLYDKATGVTAFSVVWTSKAGANQRAGRAGRTGPGHCYRLYSSAVFNDEFEEFAVPEMQRRAVDELVLQMKSLGIQRVVNFPFPSPPDHTQLKVAEEKLTLLGALKQDEKDKTEFSGKLTPLGSSMAKFPVAPRYAKMLCLSHQHNLLEYTVAIVAAMSIQELLLNTDENGGKINRKKWCGTGNSLLLGDAMVLLKIVGSAEYANSQGKLEEFCLQNSVRQKAIVEVRKIRLQLTNQINLLNPDLNLAVNPKMIPPTETQARLLRQILLAGFVDQVARKCGEETQNDKKKPIYNTPDMEDPVQIHSSCALYKEYPEWIVYQEIYETNKIYIRGVTSIEPEWLATFAPSLCNLGDPLDTPAPFYSPTTGTVRCYTTGTFGRSGWELPVIEIDYPVGLVRYKYFAVFLLDGSMFKDLEKYKTKLLSSPQTMVKSWSKFQSRTESLLKCLVSEEIDSKKKLTEMWTSNSQYLLSAYQEWLPDDLHNEVAVKWPPKN